MGQVDMKKRNAKEIADIIWSSLQPAQKNPTTLNSTWFRVIIGTMCRQQGTLSEIKHVYNELALLCNKEELDFINPHDKFICQSCDIEFYMKDAVAVEFDYYRRYMCKKCGHVIKEFPK